MAEPSTPETPAAAPQAVPVEAAPAEPAKPKIKVKKPTQRACDEKDEKGKTYDWFKVNADELVAKVSKRIEDLEILERTAQSTSSSVSYCSSYSQAMLTKFLYSVDRSPCP